MVAKEHQDEHPRIRKNIEKSDQASRENINRFNEWNYFVFYSTLNDGEKQVLSALKKPPLEFNIVEALISKLRGEFFNQEPSIEVMPDDGSPVSPDTVMTVEGHIRHILCEANKAGMEYDVYSDTLGGGFSGIKIWTEYGQEKGFKQVIRINKVYNACLCGWDPLAVAPHKGDGNFCYERYPITKEDFKRKYPKINLDKVTYTKKQQGFNWSYKVGNDDVVILCDYD